MKNNAQKRKTCSEQRDGTQKKENATIAIVTNEVYTVTDDPSKNRERVALLTVIPHRLE